ncbi:MAG: protein kinase [Acidobacteriota bacterium]
MSSVRNQIFISYAREDSDWKDRFERMLAPARDSGRVQVWTDKNIEAGEGWDETIRQELSQTAVGLLLVTPHFLESDYIRQVELQELLSAAETGEVAIRWVPVSASLFTSTELRDLQACWPPAKPLDSLDKAAASGAIQQICHEIVKKFGSSSRFSQSHLDSLRRKVQTRVGKKYKIIEEVATGKFSIVYKAESIGAKQTVAIKALVATELDDWVRQAFDAGIRRGVQLKSPAFLKIFNHFLGGSPNSPSCLVTEYVEAEQLDSVLLSHPNGLPLPQVKSILLDLARALEEAHRLGFSRGEMCPSDILVEPNGRARLSALDFSNILRAQSQVAGGFLVDRESLAYMTPESYDGEPHTQLADQYSLGLIATELLGGPHVQPVRRARDLELKRDFFRRMEAGEGEWNQRCPELAGVICRMLRLDPQLRWPTMTEVYEYIDDIEVTETLAEAWRKKAKASYLRLQTRGAEGQREFYEAFYDNFFTAFPKTEALFPAEMEQQYDMLHQAIHSVLAFRPGLPRGKERLQELAGQHARLELDPEHYEGFRDAFLATLENLEDFKVDAETLTAWRAIWSDAIELMTQRASSPSKR